VVWLLGLLVLSACAPRQARAALWGEIPRECACRDTESMARVTGDLQAAQLPVEIKMESMHDGWQVFSVTFDPTQVSADRVRQIVEGSGAQVIPSPASP